ncbi:hypothetical protein [Planococcus beigongshangi]|uniref:hypothetical protein n=1 Tax=Planococcus beigongshangi TaxID=2782536 RepID=UPI00193C4F8E|nr:hypothetical protein [Planococcus beigongshangi]
MAAQAAVDTAEVLAGNLNAQSTQAQVTAAQNAVNEAQAKVNALPASPVKLGLQARVTVAQGLVTAAQNRIYAVATQAVITAENLADGLAQDGTATQAEIDEAQTAIGNAQVLVNALPSETEVDAVKTDLQVRLDASQKKVDSAKSALAGLTKAIELVTAFVSKVDTVDEVKELVTNDAKRQEIAASYTPASNSLQSVKSSSKKTDLVNGLEAANDLVIAASFVNALQKATGDLSSDALIEQANLRLTSAKGNVNSLPNGDIKTALQDLVQAEETKINDYVKNIVSYNLVRQTEQTVILKFSKEHTITTTLKQRSAENKLIEISKPYTTGVNSQAHLSFKYPSNKAVAGDTITVNVPFKDGTIVPVTLTFNGTTKLWEVTGEFLKVSPINL